MSSQRLPLTLLGVGVALFGFAAYLLIAGTAGAQPASAATGASAEGAVEAPTARTVASNAMPEARITVDAKVRARLLPPADVVPTHEATVTVDGRVVDARVSLVAGPGSAFADAAAGKRHLVRIDGVGAGSVFRVLSVPAEGALHCALRADVELRGVVFDAHGKPAVGARLWAGSYDGEGRPLEVMTDDEGKFCIYERVGGEGIPLVVRAADHASQYRLVSLTDASLSAELRISLEHARPLTVRLAAAIDDPTLARLDLLPVSSTASLKQYPFFLAALGAFATVDSDDGGALRIGDLPGHGVIGVRATHPHARTGKPVQVDLADARRAVVTVAFGAAQRWIESTVRDGEGRPVGGAHVVLRDHANRAVPMRSGWVLPPSAHRAEPAAETTTNAAGAFAIVAPDTASRLDVTAAGHCGLRLEVGPGSVALGPVVLPSAAGLAVGPPSLFLQPRSDGYRYLVRGAHGNWTRWTGTDAFEVALDEPALVDLTIRVEPVTGDAEPEEFRLDAQPVVGPVTVDLARR